MQSTCPSLPPASALGTSRAATQSSPHGILRSGVVMRRRRRRRRCGGAPRCRWTTELARMDLSTCRAPFSLLLQSLGFSPQRQKTLDINPPKPARLWKRKHSTLLGFRPRALHPGKGHETSPAVKTHSQSYSNPQTPKPEIRNSKHRLRRFQSRNGEIFLSCRLLGSSCRDPHDQPNLHHIPLDP